jgi:hypothetical protein
VTLRHGLAIAVGVVAFLIVSFFVARWLTAENRERAEVTDLIQAQTGGDTHAMLSMLEGCSKVPKCRGLVEYNARTLRRAGKVRILRIDSATAHAVLAKSGLTRVAWDTGGTSFPVVQCIEVARRGVPVLGGPIVLTEMGPQIQGDASC